MSLRRPLNYRPAFNFDKLLEYQCRKNEFGGLSPPAVPYVPEPTYAPGAQQKKKKKKMGKVYYKVKIEEVSTGDL